MELGKAGNHIGKIKLLHMKKITLSLIVLLLIGGILSAQDRTIVGKVTSADDGSSLPGVNVVLKGTTKGYRCSG